MQKLSGQGGMSSHSSASVGSGVEHGATIHQHWVVECFAADGSLKWREEFDNLVVTAGLNKYLDAAPAWFVGIITGPGAGNTYDAADTMASHAGWTESTAYAEATRRTWTPGTVAAGAVSNAASVAVFSINATATLAGCFLVDSSTKGGSAGTLLGEGNFLTGDRPLLSGDTLNVTVTCTLAAL